MKLKPNLTEMKASFATILLILLIVSASFAWLIYYYENRLNLQEGNIFTCQIRQDFYKGKPMNEVWSFSDPPSASLLIGWFHYSSNLKICLFTWYHVLILDGVIISYQELD
jgi:hypothetical protein